LVIFFSLIAKLASIRYIFLVTSFYFEVEHMVVKITFLHGDMEEGIYMKQLERFDMDGKIDLVCKLKSSLYGLK